MSAIANITIDIRPTTMAGVRPFIGNMNPVTLVRMVVARNNAVQPGSLRARSIPASTMRPLTIPIRLMSDVKNGEVLNRQAGDHRTPPLQGVQLSVRALSRTDTTVAIRRTMRGASGWRRSRARCGGRPISAMWSAKRPAPSIRSPARTSYPSRKRSRIS